jgi:hypothetical protein
LVDHRSAWVLDFVIAVAFDSVAATVIMA